MSAMKRLFQVMADKKASDIFLSVGAPINIKINGIAVPVNQTIMTSDTVRQLLYEVLTERQAREYEEEMELNTAVALEGIGAFRISAFRQKGSPAVVVRYIPGSIPPLDSLGLPEVLKEVIMQKRGLILMVGATGAGKSTSLAAMLDFRNERRSGHILTLEDPHHHLLSAGDPAEPAARPGRRAAGGDLAAAGAHEGRHPGSRRRGAAQHAPHRRADRKRRDQRCQGGAGEEHGTRLPDLRAVAVQAVHGRQDYPGRGDGER